MTSHETDTGKRWYNDACGTAFAMELLGERWAMLIIRELMLGGRRFAELKRALPGISANVLTQRLEGLEANNVLRRRRLPSPANAHVYELTRWGYEAEPAIQALGRWAARSPAHDPTLPISPVSIMLSLRTMFDPERARGLALSAGFRCGEEAFVVRVGGGTLSAERGESPTDVLLIAEPPVLAALIYGKRPLAELESAGLVRAEGDRALLARFVDIFHLPPKAEVE